MEVSCGLGHTYLRIVNGKLQIFCRAICFTGWINVFHEDHKPIILNDVKALVAKEEKNKAKQTSKQTNQ